MTKSQTREEGLLPASSPSRVFNGENRATGEIILGIDFRSKRRERIYDADLVWSGEHTVLDYTEI
ncbi:hypothetical protein ACVILL_004333 [Bradyrhizobium sp. USDA 3364]